MFFTRYRCKWMANRSVSYTPRRYKKFVDLLTSA
jgi:hypothetical protein